MKKSLSLALGLILVILCLPYAWPKKKVTDYSEADVERIYREWAENDPEDDDDDDEDMFNPPNQGVCVCGDVWQLFMHVLFTLF